MYALIHKEETDSQTQKTKLRVTEGERWLRRGEG